MLAILPCFLPHLALKTMKINDTLRGLCIRQMGSEEEVEKFRGRSRGGGRDTSTSAPPLAPPAKNTPCMDKGELIKVSSGPFLTKHWMQWPIQGWSQGSSVAPTHTHTHTHLFCSAEGPSVTTPWVRVWSLGLSGAIVVFV